MKMKTYKLFHVDSFTEEHFSGNQAGVVLDADGLSDQMLQYISNEINLPCTAFVFAGKDKTYDVHIRFFTPIREELICGHATIAAHYVRAVENNFDNRRIYQKTGIGILPVDIIREPNSYRIAMTQGKIILGDIIRDNLCEEILDSLHICANDIVEGYPIQVASTGNAKLLIPIAHLETLNSINPNMEQISIISKKIGVSGFYLFTTPSAAPLIHGRMFAPAYGVNEDPATGNANSPLGAYLVHHKLVKHNNKIFSFKAIQGEAMKRKSIITVEVLISDNEPIEIKVSGNASILYQAEIQL